MAAHRPFLWAVLCVLVATLGLGVRPAVAERRPVAIVNLDLTGSTATSDLADQLLIELAGHPELTTLRDLSDSAALKDRIEDVDTPRLAQAQDAKARAEEQLVKFNYGLAATYAEDGQRALFAVTPSTASRKLYADLAFVLGLALFGDGKLALAQAAFVHSQRLDPDRVLDAARYLPEVVAAFAAARAAPDAPGSINVMGTGNVWIDGTEVGYAPGGFSAKQGTHVVWLTGVERFTRGATAIVLPGAQTSVEIEAAEVPRRTKVQRARITLSRAADATARAAAMTALAQLVGVADAVLLQVVGGKVIVQTWRAGNVARLPGFSALRERGREAPAELLVPLSPPRQVREVEPPPRPLPPVVDRRWYQRRSVQAGIVAGVIGLVVGGILIARSGPDSVMTLPDITNETPTVGKQ